MKKGIGIMIVLLVVLAFTAPVSAANEADTSVEIIAGGGGDPPVIKCKWETTSSADGENGDPTHSISGTQVKAPGVFDGTQIVYYWAVVTDPNGPADVDNVHAMVYHPDTSFKYKVEMPIHVTDTVAAQTYVQQAADADLLMCNGFPIDEILYELSQEDAYLWYGSEVLDYCQMGGDYRVELNAYDQFNNWAIPFNNCFTYVELALCEFDFNSVTYPDVAIATHIWAGGDDVFGTADKPTVRNIGNVPLKIQVAQDDMGFGKTSTGIWNAHYDVRLGAAPAAIDLYDPSGLKGVWTPVDADYITMTDTLPLCNTNKLDFSINVDQAQAGTYTGKIYLKCVQEIV